MSRKIVVALGGNAILSSDPSAKAQQEALEETAKHLVKLIKNGILKNNAIISFLYLC